MSTCPRCDRTISPTAITCPHCQLKLKAHGHPGMPLNRTKDNRILCTTCLYDQDNSCNFPKRPTATTCTLYQDIEKPVLTFETSKKPLYSVPWWKQIDQRWIGLGILIAISMLIALS
ncbi:MAG: hypothetical protein AAGL17_19865 [Cyanobacteria bacterium J06576_12]